MPPVEAMACACPVITCRNSSLPEVAGDAAIYVDPDSVEQMHRALLAVQQPELRASLIREGMLQAQKFSWRKMADEIGSKLAEWAVNPPSR
jgi:glycosyltransferase involved in cell wall biosynthesis